MKTHLIEVFLTESKSNLMVISGTSNIGRKQRAKIQTSKIISFEAWNDVNFDDDSAESRFFFVKDFQREFTSSIRMFFSFLFPKESQLLSRSNNNKKNRYREFHLPRAWPEK